MSNPSDPLAALHNFGSPHAAGYLEQANAEREILEAALSGKPLGGATENKSAEIKEKDEPIRIPAEAFSANNLAIPVSKNTPPVASYQDTIVVEDNKTQVTIQLEDIPTGTTDKKTNEPRTTRFGVTFSARKVEAGADSISIMMNDVMTLDLPVIPVRLAVIANGTVYNACFAGTMKFGSFRLLSFLRIPD